MMLKNLQDATQSARERISLHKPRLAGNEAQTRATLISPLLLALGWETADPAQVIQSYETAEGAADYALLDSNGDAVALILAASLGSELGKYTEPTRTGVRYVAFTNGDHWEVYAATSSPPAHLVASFSITNDPPRECAAILLLLSRANLGTAPHGATPSPAPVSATYLEAEDEGEAVRVESPRQSREVGLVWPRERRQPSLADSPHVEWVSLFSYDPEPYTPPPSRILFPDDSERPTQFWRDLVLQTASWLWETEQLSDANVPVPMRGNSYIVNFEPLHRDGRPFSAQQPVPNSPLIAEAIMRADTSRQNARRLLAHCGVDSEDVYVGLS